MMIDTPALNATFCTLAEATAETGYSRSKLLRSITDGLPLTGRKLRCRKERRKTAGCVPTRELVCVSREDLAEERRRETELGKVNHDGLSEKDACKTWGVSSKTLNRKVAAGEVARSPVTVLRGKQGKGTAFRYMLIGQLPLKNPPLKPARRRITIDGEMLISTRETASQLRVDENAVLDHVRKGDWHGIPFVSHTHREAFYFSQAVVNEIRRVLERARKAGWRGAGPLPAEAAPESVVIDGVRWQSVTHLAEKIGVTPSLIVGRWGKKCPHLCNKPLWIKRRGRKPLIAESQAMELEKNFLAKLATGWNGMGRPRPEIPVYRIVNGEQCILVRDAAKILAVKLKTFRQWKDRDNAPGLNEAIRIHTKARSWSYVPVAQFKIIAAALGVTFDLPSEPDNGHHDAVPRRRGRPARNPNRAALDFKLREDLRRAGCGEQEFARRKGITVKELRDACKRDRARTQRQKLRTK